MKIRKANYGDVLILNNFLTLLIRDERQYDLGIDEDFVVTNMYENYIEDNNRLLIVGEEENEVKGYLYGYLKESDATYKYKVAKLDALYILDNWRNKGLAKALIAYFKDWCITKNVDIIEVNVCTQNKKAKNLYEQLNFKTINETLALNIQQK